MNSREWFCLALRVLGVWQLVEGLSYLPGDLSSYLQTGPLGSESAGLSVMTWSLTKLAIGLFLVLGAPFCAAVCYPKQPPGDSEAARVLPAQFLRVGLRLLGAWLVVRGGHTLLVSLAKSGLDAYYTHSPWNEAWPVNYLGDITSTCIDVGLGIAIFVGPQHIVAVLDRLRYSAERDAYTPPPLEADTGSEEANA